MMKSLQISVLLILVSTLLACSSNDSADAGGESKLLSKQSTEIEIYFPDNPLRYINKKVTEGEWTIEQGLITALKYSSGDPETQEEYPADPEGVGVTEWSDIISLAQDYITRGEDAKAKAEMRRLLDKQYIDIEELEKWSRPAGKNSGARRKPDLPLSNTLVDFLVSPAKAQTGSSDDCQAIWASVNVVDGSSGHCFDINEWSHRGANLRIFYPTLWRDDPVQQGWVATAKDAVNASIDKYNDDLALIIGSIDLAFYTADFENDRANSHSIGSDRDCYVRIFPISTMQTPNNVISFKQTLAHEIFHCYQFKNLYGHTMGSAALRSSDDFAAKVLFRASRLWWVDGTAEYFGNTVYPCNQKEYERIGKFDSESPVKSLVDINQYSTFIFFMYLSKWGDKSTIQFLRTLPTQGGQEEQLRALKVYPMGPKFKKFGQDYLTDNIFDTCPGVKLPLTPMFDTFMVCDGCEEIIPMDSFQLARRELVFGPGHSEIEYQHGDSFLVKTATEDHFTWDDAPEIINAGCREPPVYIALFINEDQSERQKELTIYSQSQGDSDRKHDVDSCLIGNWNATQGSIDNIADWVAANPLTRKFMKTRSEQTSGGFSGTFSRNGVVTGNMNSLTQEYSSEVKIGKKVLTIGTKVVINGDSRAEYSAKGNILKVWNACGENSARAISELDGKVMSDKVIDLGKFSDMGTVDGLRRQKNTDKSDDAYSPLVNATEIIPLDWEFRYRCQGNSLEIDPPAQLKGRPPWEFNRGSAS